MVSPNFHGSYSSLQLCCESPWFTSTQDDECDKGRASVVSWNWEICSCRSKLVSTLPMLLSSVLSWRVSPQKPLKFISDGELGGSGILYLTSTRHLSPSQWFWINVRSCVSHFNVSLNVWAKSQQDCVHEPQILKGKESRIGLGPTSVRLPPCRLTARPSRLRTVEANF